jgi:hypothetical protein
MDIRRISGMRTDPRGFWRGRFDALTVRMWSRVSPASTAAGEAPPVGWDEELVQGALTLSGYTFLRDGGPTRTKPCADNIRDGGCPRAGVFLPLCASIEQARVAARQDLDKKDSRARILGERRWIWPVSIDAYHVYNLGPRINAKQAEYLRSELFHRDGNGQPIWSVAKQPGCDGLYLPTDPPTLFVFERVYPDYVEYGARDPRPVVASKRSLRNVLDFVRDLR